MSSFKDVISRIEKNLNGNNLPGLEAQVRMAPTRTDGVEFSITPTETCINSAVFIGLFPKNDVAHTLFIKRGVYDGVHSGQVSFPGGKQENQDASIEATALRETYEEVGIDTSSIKILGKLTPLFISVSNMLVHPIIGVMPEPQQLKINRNEVEYAFAVSLEDFKNRKLVEERIFNSSGFPVSAPYFNCANETIWGATAMIIAELTELY